MQSPASNTVRKDIHRLSSMKYSLKISNKFKKKMPTEVVGVGNFIIGFIQWVNGQREERPVSRQFSSAFYDNQYYIHLLWHSKDWAVWLLPILQGSRWNQEATCPGHELQIREPKPDSRARALNHYPISCLEQDPPQKAHPPLEEVSAQLHVTSFVTSIPNLDINIKNTVTSSLFLWYFLCMCGSSRKKIPSCVFSLSDLQINIKQKSAVLFHLLD